MGDAPVATDDDRGVAREPFRPAWWLPSPHLQTLWPALARRPLRVATRRERIELPDGDFVDLDWAGESDRFIVLLLHGLEGSSASSYMQGMMAALVTRGWQAVALNFRGCSGEHNRLDRSYHSGETSDVGYIVDNLRERFPSARLAAIGYSLGGNALLKYLGESGEDCALAAAVAVSVPLRLERAAARMSRGLSRLYQWRLVGSLREKMRAKFRRRRAPLDLAALGDWRDFRSFDHHVTAPLHGFSSAEDYYARCSSRQFLTLIRTPTLLLQARDDPFMYPDVLPSSGELSSSVDLEVSECGGHVGFVAGSAPWRAIYWLEQRAPEFLGSRFEDAAPRKSRREA